MNHPLWAQPAPHTPLGRADLHLWLVELDVSPPELALARTVLSVEEAERAARFHFERDRRRFIASHAALRSIIARYVGLAPDVLAFLTTTHGKPFLAPRADYALADLAFNLSHSGELALVAVAAGRRVGIDIELIRPELADGQIAERYFSAAEVRALAALPEEDRPRAFFRCWTRKEAFVKARGEGLALPLANFDVSLGPDEPAALLHTADDPDLARRWTLHAVPIDAVGAYEAAVVAEGKLERILRWLYRGDTFR